MYKHHEETIEKMLEQFKANEEVLALLLTGSIAHGFATAKSDIDIMIIVSEENYSRRVGAGELTYWDNKISTYEEGYIDGKFISRSFIEKVAEIGSEPARFAFDGAIILYSKVEGLEQLLKKITQYPIERKEDNIKRFFSQFQGWKWFCYEAIKHNNEYLLTHAISSLILFGGRMILSYNEKLYPYHKWFMRVLEESDEKPEGIITIINELLLKKDKENIERFYDQIIHFTNWNIDDIWTNQFVLDSELNWLNGNTPVSDI